MLLIEALSTLLAELALPLEEARSSELLLFEAKMTALLLAELSLLIEALSTLLALLALPLEEARSSDEPLLLEATFITLLLEKLSLLDGLSLLTELALLALLLDEANSPVLVSSLSNARSLPSHLHFFFSDFVVSLARSCVWLSLGPLAWACPLLPSQSLQASTDELSVAWQLATAKKHSVVNVNSFFIIILPSFDVRNLNRPKIVDGSLLRNVPTSHSKRRLL